MTKGKGEKQAPKSSLEGMVTHRQERQAEVQECGLWNILQQNKSSSCFFPLPLEFHKPEAGILLSVQKSSELASAVQQKRETRIKFCDLLNVKAQALPGMFMSVALTHKAR